LEAPDHAGGIAASDGLRDDLLTILNAKSLAVITTWDLFRLAVNRQTHNWPTKALEDRLSASALSGDWRRERILAKKRAVVIRLTAPLAAGDRIAF
jgi:hypothetical protein